MTLRAAEGWDSAYTLWEAAERYLDNWCGGEAPGVG
jgi:hypothetical protein